MTDEQSPAPVKKKRYYKSKKGTALELPDKHLPATATERQIVAQVNKLTDLTVFVKDRLTELQKITNDNAKRPALVQTNPSILLELASIGCTVPEIATIVGCDEATLRKNQQYMELINVGREETKTSLRRKQLDVALNSGNNTTMLIWLGKQLLNQRDQPQTQVNIQNNVDTSGLRDKLKQVLSSDTTAIDGVVLQDGENND